MAIMANRGNSWTKSKDIPSVVILSFAQTITSYFRKDSNSQRRFACCEMRQTVKNRHQVLLSSAAYCTTKGKGDGREPVLSYPRKGSGHNPVEDLLTFAQDQGPANTPGGISRQKPFSEVREGRSHNPPLQSHSRIASRCAARAGCVPPPGAQSQPQAVAQQLPDSHMHNE